MPAQPRAPARPTTKTTAGLSLDPEPTFSRGADRTPPVLPAFARHRTGESRCAFPRARTRSARKSGSAPPSPSATLDQPRPPDNWRSRSRPFRSSLPWLASLLEWKTAEPALLPSRRQQIAQHKPRPQQPRFYRGNGDSQCLRSLLNVPMFHVAQHENLPILSIERSQRLCQPLPHFFALQRFGGNLAPVRKVSWQVFLFVVAMVINTFHDYGSLPAPAHQRFVYCDLDQPRAEARFGAKLPQVSQSLEHRLLRRVFRIRLVAQNCQCSGIYPALIGPHQFVEQ